MGGERDWIEQLVRLVAGRRYCVARKNYHSERPRWICVKPEFEGRRRVVNQHSDLLQGGGNGRALAQHAAQRGGHYPL
jgi:hypothetical protein